jgi:hypothetical protein
MKLAIFIIIFISGVIIIYLSQKIKDLEKDLEFLAGLLFSESLEKGNNCYELKEDEDGTIVDAAGNRYKMIKAKVDKKK